MLPSPRITPLTFTLIIALVALGPLSTDLYLPALPALVAALATDTARGQLTLTAYLIGFALGLFLYGPLADRYGRRPIILIGLFLYTLATILCLFAPTIDTLIAARLLQALGAGVGPVLGRTLVRDLCGPRDSAPLLALVGAVMAIVPMLAPLLGGLLAQFLSWRAPFAILLLYSLIALLAIWRWLPETRPPLPPPTSLFAAIPHLLADRVYRLLLLANGCSYAALFSFISGSSFILIGIYGYTPFAMGLSFTFIVSGYLLGTLAAHRTVRRLGSHRLLTLGACFALFGALLQILWPLLSPAPPALLIPMWFCALAAGFIMPNATALALAPYPQAAGAAAALLGLGQMAIAALAGTLVGQLLTDSPLPLAVTIAITALTAALAILCTPSSSPNPAHSR
ncbi:MAG: multidrug effflux MFS transporter [Hydrogenophilus sp.]|nr:multidrug effflux MFS transporter [Hydrogenophilus sp.]